MSYNIENNHIVASLMKEIDEQGFIDSSYGNSIESFKRNPEKGNLIEVNLKNGETITTNLIIGSEGRGSKVKELSGISTHGWMYG